MINYLIKNQLAKPVIIVIPFIILFILQILHLDSDPSPIIRWGTMSDEGFWQHNARMKIMFGNFCTDEFRLAYLGAPIFNQFLYISYKLLGISLFSARILNVISYCFILIMIFYLLNRKFGIKNALISTFLFGFMHEMLMYVNWSTPVILELCFLLAIIYFHQLGIHKCKDTYLLLSGISYSCAVLSKLTSVLFILSLGIFFALEIHYKRCNYRKIIWFIYGVLLVFIPFIIFFGIKNLHFYLHLFSIQAEWFNQNFEYQSKIIVILQNIITAPLSFTIMKFPSAVILFIITMFYFLQQFVKLILNKYKIKILSLDSVETFSIAWIIGITLALCINNQIGVPRRMIQLYVPFFLLSSYYVLEKKEYVLALFRLNRRIFITIIICSSILISFYISSVYYMSFIHWLGIFFNDEYILIISRTRYFLLLGFILTYFIFCCNSIKSLKIVIGMFFLINMTLNTIWYLNATYTLRDATATLEKYSKPLAYSYGTTHYWLGINRYTYPIVTLGKKINQKMSVKLRSENILLLDRRNILKDQINYSIVDNDEFYSGDTTKAAMGLGVIKVLGVEIDKRMIKHLSYLRLAPYPFSNVFRDEINLYSLQPGSFLP